MYTSNNLFKTFKISNKPELSVRTAHKLEFSPELKRHIEADKEALINQHKVHKRLGFGFPHVWRRVFESSLRVKDCGLAIVREPVTSLKAIPFAFKHLKEEFKIADLPDMDAGIDSKGCIEAVNRKIHDFFGEHKFEGYIETLFDFIPEIQPLNGEEVYLPSYVSMDNFHTIPWPWPETDLEDLKKQPLLNAAMKKEAVNEYRFVSGRESFSGYEVEDLHNDDRMANVFRQYYGFYRVFVASDGNALPDNLELIDPILFGSFLAYVKGKLILPRNTVTMARIIDGMRRLNKFAEEELELGLDTFFEKFDQLDKATKKKVLTWPQQNARLLKLLAKYRDQHPTTPKSKEELEHDGRWLSLDDFHRVMSWFHTQLSNLMAERPLDSSEHKKRINSFYSYFKGALPVIFNGVRRQVIMDVKINSFRTVDGKFVYSFLVDRLNGTHQEKRQRFQIDLPIDERWRASIEWWCATGRSLYWEYQIHPWKAERYGHDYMIVNTYGGPLHEDTFTTHVKEAWVEAQQQLDPPIEQVADKIGPGSLRSLVVTAFVAATPNFEPNDARLLSLILNTSVDRIMETYNKYPFLEEQLATILKIHGPALDAEQSSAVVAHDQEMPLPLKREANAEVEEELLAQIEITEEPDDNVVTCCPPKPTKKRKRPEATATAEEPPSNSDFDLLPKPAPFTPSQGHRLYDVFVQLSELRETVQALNAREFEGWFKAVKRCLMLGYYKTRQYDYPLYQSLRELQSSYALCWRRDGKFLGRLFFPFRVDCVKFVTNVLESLEQFFPL